MKNSKSITTQILLIIAVLLVINFLSNNFFFRLDFTADQRYTLSEATKNILKSLDEPITVTAYFTEDLPPDLSVTRSDFKDLLVEYASVSKGLVLYEFVNPNKDQESEQKAFQAGVQPVLVQTREKDEATQKKVFMGAVLQKGDKKEIIPFMQPGAAMEYALSTNIKKLSVTDKPFIGIIQGHGEPGLNAMSQVMESMSILYTVEPVNLDDSAADLRKYKTIAIIGPRDTIPPRHFQMLDKYLADGGNLFIGIDRVDGDLSTVQGKSVETGLEKWLSDKGLMVENNFVVDANCGSVGVQQRQSFFNFTTQVRFPYLPIITNFEDHPATKGLEQVLMPFVSSITYTGDTANHFVPLARTSEKSGTQSTPLYFDINKQWTDTDFPLSNLVVGAILEGKLAGDAESGIALFADGQFMVNGEGQRAQQLSKDNVSLMVNSIDYLSDDTGLIDLRTKGITSRPLDQIDDGRKVFLKWLNFLVPIFLILIYGIVRMQRRRNLRVKRMEQGYI
ncbi:MAG: Gldg family protein [Bacteroidales bacterium]|nr:Gldg family protein [Bacteroidales bacterium]MCF8404863.1 Gldg family protein [Bacteroidales bacterium]